MHVDERTPPNCVIRIEEGWSCPEIVIKHLDGFWFDAQISLSCRLRDFFRDHPEDESIGKFISLWVILGSLIESSLVFFLTVYWCHTTEKDSYRKYLKNSEKISKARFSDVIEFIKKEEVFGDSTGDYVQWLGEIKNLRNSVHSSDYRKIDNLIKLEKYIIKYKGFLEEIDTRLPWPD